MTVLETAIQNKLLTRDKKRLAVRVGSRVCITRVYRLRSPSEEDWQYVYGVGEKAVKRLTKKEKTQMAILMAAHDPYSGDVTEVEGVGAVLSIGTRATTLKFYLVVEELT